MPVGPNGEKRPHGVIECATMVARIATGEIEEVYVDPPRNAESNGAGPPKRKPKRRVMVELAPRQSAPARAEK